MCAACPPRCLLLNGGCGKSHPCSESSIDAQGCVPTVRVPVQEFFCCWGIATVVGNRRPASFYGFDAKSVRPRWRLIIGTKSKNCTPGAVLGTELWPWRVGRGLRGMLVRSASMVMTLGQTIVVIDRLQRRCLKVPEKGPPWTGWPCSTTYVRK